MNNNGNLLVWSPYFKIYDPLKAGSIDGTDLIPHDNAVISAMCAEYVPPDEQTTTSNPKLTLFVGRLNVQTSERQLDEEFSKYGKLKSCRLVQDIATGMSRGYGFVEFKKETDAQKAWKFAHGSNFHDRQIIVEWEFARTMPGWIPRRLGGGLGGRKESGQLRFGGRDRPFRRPFILPHIDEPSSCTPATESSQKHLNDLSSHNDGFDCREKDMKETTPGFSRYECDGKISWSKNYCDEDRRKYKRQAHEKISEHFHQGRDSSEMKDGSHNKQYSWDKGFSKKYETYKPSNYEERYPQGRRDHHWDLKETGHKSSNYSKKYSHSRSEDFWGHASQDSHHYIEYAHDNKRDLYSQESRHKDKMYDKRSYDMHYCYTKPSQTDKKSESQKGSFKNECEIKDYYKESVKHRHKREYSSETSSSCESSSRSKRKKSKHKKKRYKSDSDESVRSSKSKAVKKHKHKKKKKSKKKHSSRESD